MEVKLYTLEKKFVDLSDHESQMKPNMEKTSTSNIKSAENVKTKECQSAKKPNSLYLNLTILQWLGLWPCDEDTMHFKAQFLRIFFCFVITIQGTINIVEIMDMVVNWGHLTNPTENVYTMGCSVTAIVKEVTIILKTKNIKNLVNILNNELAAPRKQGSPDYQKKIVKSSIRQARMFTLIFISMCLFVGISYSFVPLIDTLLQHSGNKTSHRPMPYTAWFPFDVSETPVYEAAYFYLALETTFNGVYIPCCDALFVTLIIHLCGQFQILQASLRDIKADAMKKVQATYKEKIRRNNINSSPTETVYAATLEPAEFGNEKAVHCDTNDEKHNAHIDIYLTNEDLDNEMQYLLKQCIKHHQILLQFVHELEYICSPFMVVQLLGSLVLICFTGFNMATVPVQSVKFVSALVFMTAAITQLFFFCWYSEELSFQNCKVYQAAYDCDWHEASQSFKTSIQLIMKRAQTARALTAANFCSVNLETFTAIMRLSYSNYALLRQVYDENNMESTKLE